MTRAIEIEYPRTLVLENTARLPLESLQPDVVTTTARSLSRFIRGNGGSPTGPLVQVVEQDVAADGPASGSVSLLRQSSSSLAESPGIHVEERLEVNGCIVARFRGDASDVDIVYAKINVFAYENRLALEGTMYLVFVGEDGMNLAVDAFASVDGSGRHASR